MNDFNPLPKMARLSRQVVVTEKIDGTNASICIGEDGEFLVGSRTRWITQGDDNFGFARWAHDHKEELLAMGPGHHFGEWWGSGIQRGYGLPKGEKRFSLFNVLRWCLHGEIPREFPTQDPRIAKTQDVLPACCGLVPVLYEGLFDTARVDGTMTHLGATGSAASPGFMKPEGIVVFHTAANMCFKKTLGNDGAKGEKK